MPEVYARQFVLAPRPAYQPDEAITASFDEWVRHRCPDAPTFDMGRPFVVETQNRSILRWEPFRDGDRALNEFVWRHPHEGAPDITWSTTVSCFASGSRLSLAIRVSNTGPILSDPRALLTTRPRLLLALREFFTITCEGERCDGEPITLTGSDLPFFVRYDLFDPRRRMPTLVLAPHRNGQYLIDANSLATDFMSLASVRVIDEPDSTFGLTAELGSKALSCFHGAARLYLPGLGRNSDPMKHPLVLPRRLTDATERMKLARFLAYVTVRQFTIDGPVNEERDRLRDQRAVAYARNQSDVVATLQRSLTEARRVQDFEALAALYQADSDRLRAKSEDLRAQFVEVDGRVRWLEAERGRLLKKLEEGEVVDDEIAVPEVDDVEQAVETAAELFIDQLLILPRAYEAARDSGYLYPGKVIEALRVLAQVAERRNGGVLGMSLEEAFKSLGFEYSGGISKSSSRKHRQQYRVTDEGREYECEEHIKMGVSRDPRECLRIYFTSRHPGESRFVIGHVGEHLDTRHTN